MINQKNTLFIGHRGVRAEAPENTLFGFQHALSLQPHGLSGIEFDVQLTADGHLIVFHDDTLKRLCGLQSWVDQLSLAQIQRYTQSGHPIITLASVSRVLTPFKYIELEIKTHNRTHYERLMQSLTRELVDSELSHLPLVLTTFDTQLLAHLQRSKLLAKIPRALLVRSPELLKPAVNTALQLGCSRLGVFYPLLTKSVIQDAHRYGLPVTAWTVNDIDAIKQLIEWQTDAIITDIPSQLLLG